LILTAYHLAMLAPSRTIRQPLAVDATGFGPDPLEIAMRPGLGSNQIVKFLSRKSLSHRTSELGEITLPFKDTCLISELDRHHAGEYESHAAIKTVLPCIATFNDVTNTNA